MARITKNSRTKTINGALRELNKIIETVESHKNTYFWTPPRVASMRRAREFKDVYNMDILGSNIEVTLELSMSCSNVYFTKEFYVDGKKTNLTKIKGFAKRLNKILERRK